MILFIEKNFFLNCHDFCLSTSVLRGNALVLLPLKQSYVSTLVDELCVRRGAVLGQHKPLCSPECHAGIYIWTSCLCSELVHVCYPDFGKGLTKIIFWSGPLLLRHMSVKCKRFCFALLKKETNLKIFEICYSSRMSGDFRHMYCKKRGWCSVFQRKKFKWILSCWQFLVCWVVCYGIYMSTMGILYWWLRFKYYWLRLQKKMLIGNYVGQNYELSLPPFSVQCALRMLYLSSGSIWHQSEKLLRIF